MPKGYWKSKNASLWNNLPEYLQPRILSAVAFVNSVAPDLEKAIKRINIVSKSLSLKEMNWVMHLLSLERIGEMMTSHPDFEHFKAERKKERTIN